MFLKTTFESLSTIFFIIRSFMNRRCLILMLHGVQIAICLFYLTCLTEFCTYMNTCSYISLETSLYVIVLTEFISCFICSYCINCIQWPFIRLTCVTITIVKDTLKYYKGCCELLYGKNYQLCNIVLHSISASSLVMLVVPL